MVKPKSSGIPEPNVELKITFVKTFHVPMFLDDTKSDVEQRLDILYKTKFYVELENIISAEADGKTIKGAFTP